MRRRGLVLRLSGKRREDDLQLFLDLAKLGRDEIYQLLLSVDQFVKLFHLTLLMSQLNLKIINPVTHHATSATAGGRIQP